MTCDTNWLLDTGCWILAVEHLRQLRSAPQAILGLRRKGGADGDAVDAGGLDDALEFAAGGGAGGGAEGGDDFVALVCG